MGQEERGDGNKPWLRELGTQRQARARSDTVARPRGAHGLEEGNSTDGGHLFLLSSKENIFQESLSILKTRAHEDHGDILSSAGEIESPTQWKTKPGQPDS